MFTGRRSYFTSLARSPRAVVLDSLVALRAVAQQQPSMAAQLTVVTGLLAAMEDTELPALLTGQLTTAQSSPLAG